MTLPSIDEREYVLARAFIAWLNTQLGEQQELGQEELLARYGHMRLHRADLLSNLAGEQQRRESPLARVREQFDSEKCPACGQEKRKCKDFFCRSCWTRLPRNLQGPLIPGWRDGRNVDHFLRALNWLRREQSAVGAQHSARSRP